MTEQKETGQEAGTKINKVTCKGFKSFQRKSSIPFYKGLTAVVGENGSGKCVTGDSKVVLGDGAEKRIDELVESALEDDCREIDDGFISHEGKESVLSLNPRTLQVEKRNVLAYAKREAPEKLVKIRTRSGREITATEDHPLFHLNDEGEVEAIDTENLSEGTRIAVPREIEASPDKVFDNLLNEIEKEDGLYVPYQERYEDLIYGLKQDKTWEKLAEDIGVSYNTLRGIRDEQACNAASLIKILRYSGKSDEEIIREIDELKSKNHSKTIRLPSANSEEFSRFLGYMLAEGSVPNSSGQVRFINEKEEIVSNFEELASEVFDIETSREEYSEGCWDVIIYSQALNTLLRKFGMDGAAGKNVSDTYLNSTGGKEISALLEGLYAGDGYLSDSSVTLTSKSRDLAEGIQSLMLRIGVNSSVSEITKSSGDHTGKYYKVSVSGVENIRKLRDNLQIPHQMKQERMNKLVEKRPDTNHDTVEANQLVKNAVDGTDIQVASRENRKKIPKLEAYCKDKCKASREGLKEVAKKIDDEGGETGQIEKLANSDIYWDEIKSIEYIEPESDWVYDLNVGVGHNYIAENTFVHNSNILDALSFVFGRRSSKLRAEKMQQLIFNGGESRKEADYAKVSVHLDNSSGIFDEFLEEEEADEIKVGRKITQAGSSMYKFQGSNCKASKIDDIARKANIDPGGYHFVRQGKVTEIVEQSNLERRKVVDELSGVAEFDEKKEEAEEELEEVEDRLQEQEIILKEKKEQLDKLKEEKELALKYRELEERKEKLEASILEVRKRALSNQLANINTDTSEKRERIEELEEELEELDSQIDEKQDRIEEIEDKQSQSNTDIQHLENRIEKKKGKIENKREKIENLEDTIEELEKMKNRGGGGNKKRAVKAVLKMDNDDIHGAFEDLISVDERFAVAIQTAAGGHMDDVVVEDRHTATEAINYLKRESIGRARMLPMDKIKDRSKSAKSKMAKKKKGVIGFASELVDNNSRFDKAIRYVFSDTLIAEDLDSVKDIDGVRVVTLDGDVMSRGGAMSGGKKKKRKGRSSKSLSKSLDPEAKKKEKEEVEDEIKDLQKDIAELKQMKERKEEEQETDEELREEKKQIREDLQDMRDERQELYSEKQKLKSKIDQVGSKKANLKAELDNVKEDQSEYEFDKDELKGLDSSPEELKSKKRKVVKKQNSMGPVNMRAIDEYKRKKEEFDEFKDQVSEIRQEKLEIEDMIAEIEQKKRERFMDTLTELQDSFTEIFGKLFGGGNGELILEDDDINKGLKIRAAPPNKDPHIITALSGGEKTMTAIAFVFAILEYEESPFYIMDEIDAALDTTNSKKLSELLKEYAEGNQFIVISHNDITVRHAERAYGVSMRDGVSKVRSIELDE